MMLKLLILAFGIFAISRSYLRYKDRLLTLAGALFWSALWVLIILSVIFKEWTSSFSQYFGIGRGADLLLFGAVLFLSYLSFRLYVRVEEMRQDLTRLIRALAIREAEHHEAEQAEGEALPAPPRQPTSSNRSVSRHHD
jgi:hypothetical protein